MPSMLHEALLVLFRNRPSLAPEMLHDALGVELPRYTEIRFDEADFTQLVPTEYRADLVVLLYQGEPVYGIVVEVQLDAKEDKRFKWPVYQAVLRSKLKCGACVLVVTPHEEVARWASKPIDTGQPGSPFLPLVLGPGAVPWMTQVDQAERAPELAVLSALAHGAEERAVEVALAAVGAIRHLELERRKLYYDLVYNALNAAVRVVLETKMSDPNYQLQNPEAVQRFEDFLRRTREEGEAKGKTEGKAEGKAEALLGILAARGLPVTESERARILATTDLGQLDRWIQRAVNAASAGEVFR